MQYYSRLYFSVASLKASQYFPALCIIRTLHQLKSPRDPISCLLPYIPNSKFQIKAIIGS